MTIAILMKINDYLILATDSSSTIFGKNESGGDEVYHTYFSAEKLFNIKKDFPVGIMTWGEGSVNNESISTLIKDYDIESVGEEYVSVMNTANSFKEFLERKIVNDVTVGFLLAGFTNDGLQEIILINVVEGKVNSPIELNKDDPLVVLWFGNTNFLSRFLIGFDENLVQILKNNGLSDELINNIIEDSKKSLQLPLGVPAMPLNDAINLVKFLADISVKSSNFVPGAQVIGGPIDIAVISKHEGFKWIDRKYYYDENSYIQLGGN